MALEAVIFDMDGVLVDSEPLHYAMTNAVLAPHGVAVEPDLYASLTGMGEAEFFELLVRRFALDAAPEQLLRQRLALCLERLASDPLPPTEGAAECLLALQLDGWRLALASSATRLQVDLVLARTGLRALFEVTVSIDDVDRGKPAPDLFVRAAEGLGVAPDACVVIEDAALGVTAAIAAGMLPVALVAGVGESHAHRDAGAVAVLRSLRELTPEGLERLASG